MNRHLVSLFSMRRNTETKAASAKPSAAEEASPFFTPNASGAGVEDATLDLRRAFRTPPPLMGGGWRAKQGQS